MASYEVTTKIAESLTTATASGIGKTVHVLYSLPVEKSEVENLLKDDTDIAIFFMAGKDDTSDNQTISTFGAVTSLQGMLIIFSKVSYQCVKKLSEFLDATGFESVTALSSSTPKTKAPYTLGNLDYWKFKPLGGRNNAAEKWGTKLFVIDQLMDIQVQII